jgi:acyl carrier protein
MFEQIRDVLVSAINIKAELITPQANLRDDLDIDSLSAVELALELETTFDIRIEDEELGKLETVQDIIDIVSAKKA